jgi:hypothetical protein
MNVVPFANVNLAQIDDLRQSGNGRTRFPNAVETQ